MRSNMANSTPKNHILSVKNMKLGKSEYAAALLVQVFIQSLA